MSRRDAIKAVLIEDNENDAELVVRMLEKSGHACEWVRVDTRDAFLERIGRGGCDLVLCDYSLPAFDCLAALQLLREKDKITPFILISGQPDHLIAVEALRIGATDYLAKGHLDRLPVLVERALKEARGQSERRLGELALASSEQKLRSIFDQALDVILVIQGVTGTILRANRAALDVLGYRIDELEGKHFSLLFPPEGELRPDALLARIRVSGPIFESQPFRRADGTVCPMDITAALIPWGNTQAILTTLRDVTVRNQVEEALRMTQFAVDHCKHLILWTRPDGRLCYVNQAACDLLGYTSAELLALNIAQVDPGFGPEIWPVHWEELKTFGSFTLNSEMRRKDGNRVPVETVVNYFSYQGAEYNCAIARDVTERRRSEQALLDLNAGLERRVEERTQEVGRSEKRLRALLHHTSDLFSILDTEGIIRFTSESVTPLLGYPWSDFIGTDWFSHIHPDDRAEAGDALRRARAEPDTPVRFERRVARKEGGWLAFESILTNQLDDPAIGGFIVNSRDITERKQIHEDLQAARQRFQFLISASPAVLFTRKAGGGCDPAWISDNVAHLTGFTPDAVTGAPGFWAGRIEPDDLAVLLSRLAKALSDGSQLNEYRFRHRDGRTLWLQEELTVIRGPEGRPLELVGYLIDVTDRRLSTENLRLRDEELSRTNAELRRATRLKDEFLASMSHELRTPLNAVLTLSEVLLEGAYGPLTAKQAESLQTIERSGQHLLDLIGDILDLSKIESGKLELAWETVSVERACEESLSLVREAAYRKRIRVELRDGVPSALFRADPRRLNQILLNLLSNAVKFTPEDGEVRLEVERDREGDALLFHVVDTGIGIAAADLPRLFRPFVQLDSSLARRYAGTGLGLSLVSRLVRLHQGSVTVESQPGVGSRFTIRLPAGAEDGLPRAEVPDPVDPATAESLPPPPRDAPAGRPLLLLAEDNETALHALTEYLTLRGYDVLTARTGYEAIEQAKLRFPDLILMDIQMPEMDGLEAIVRLRALRGTAGIPIIALTALAMPGDRERCLAAGAADYLSKPVSLKRLLARIAALLPLPASSPREESLR